jgi:Ran GTPase-activating protein (RanGAP) involved in mRNA processing and transport
MLPTLTQCVVLAHLDLSDNNITAIGVQSLVTVLLETEWRLQDLLLADNWYGPAGVHALSLLLEADVELRRLDVSNTGVRPMDSSRLDSDQNALQALADALRVCNHMYRTFIVIQTLNDSWQLRNSSIYTVWTEQHPAA